MSEDGRLRQRFVSLCETPSPTGSERAVADAVLAELRGLGIDVVEDEAAGPARAGAGNLIARVPGAGEGWVMFCAHLDTVPVTGPIEVELADGVYRSRGETILGADDKAAVAVLVELAARHVTRAPEVGIELVFTVAEEEGLRGARELDLGALRSPFGFVLDHASPIGELITAAPSHQRLVAEFEGVEAHAGIRPEAGRSAIEAAAAAIATMRLGRLDPQTTANIGLIDGGTASNVVAGRCRIEGEARSLDGQRVAETINAMLDACAWAASESSCDLDLDVIEVFRGYRLPSSVRPVRLARAALERCGHQAREVATGGGSDANALVARGFECALLANGTEANHTPTESVGARRLTEMLEVCEAIVDLAAEGDELMLKLRSGMVVSIDPLIVDVRGERRPAWADAALVGGVEVGDEVVVNTEAQDLGLGSGGFDLVHVNLSRGLDAPGTEGAHVIKLNYTSLQHPVVAAELADADEDPLGGGPKPPVLAIPLHGHLAPAAWAAAQAAPGLRVGFVQGAGAALPGGLSRDLAELRERGLVCGHLTAGAAYGGEHEAISLVGGLDAAARGLGWDAVVVGPGPGILGSATRLGHGGIAALDAAHAALALGLPTLVAPRLSSSDERPRHRGLSHHTASVLELLLAPVRVPVPEAELEGWPLLAADAPEGGSARAALDDLIAICAGRHDLSVEAIDLDGYAASGLPARTMGRELADDPLFFAAALAAGAGLAGAVEGAGR